MYYVSLVIFWLYNLIKLVFILSKFTMIHIEVSGDIRLNREQVNMYCTVYSGTVLPPHNCTFMYDVCTHQQYVSISAQL